MFYFPPFNSVFYYNHILCLQNIRWVIKSVVFISWEQCYSLRSVVQSRLTSLNTSESLLNSIKYEYTIRSGITRHGILTHRFYKNNVLSLMITLEGNVWWYYRAWTFQIIPIITLLFVLEAVYIFLKTKIKFTSTLLLLSWVQMFPKSFKLFNLF